MRGIGVWWRERRVCRENAAYLEAEVEVIDLAALEREREWEPTTMPDRDGAMM